MSRLIMLRREPLNPWFCLLTLLLVFACISPARAERFALLVGVSNYPALDPKLHLEGPRNDIPLIRSVLDRRGFKPQQVTMLADGVSGAGDPTRAAILGELDRIASSSKSGDFVFLYFAGHGSQMPADRNNPKVRSKPDGLHEIFLPRDVGKWEDKAGTVQNAILDDEFVERLDKMLAKGVFVWAVFDACHSATLMRGVADDEVKYRQVSPLSLGIPAARLDAAAADEVRTRGGPPSQPEPPIPAPTASSGTGAGGYVAFYAAQTTETTPEMRLPLGHPQRKPYGLFGFTVADALGSTEGVSYRQLGQHVLQRYAAQNVASPTPMFTGSHLDAPIFGTEGGVAVRQWPIETEKGLTIPAGVLNQLAAGDVLALVASPLAKPGDVIGYVKVDKAEVLNATLVPVAYNDKPALDLAKLPPGAFARQISSQLNLKLRISAPSKGNSPAQQKLQAAIDAVQKEKPRGVDLQWVAADQELDLRMVIEDGQVWLVSPAGQLIKTGANKTLSIKIDQPEFQAKLVDTLQRIGKAVNLLRISSQLEGTAAARNMETSIAIKKKDGSKPPATGVPVLLDGDVVELTIKNKGRAAVDITALYVDGDYGIGVLYPYQPGASNRIEAGATDTIKIDIHDDTTGMERLLLIAVEARAGADRYDFSFMAQARLERTRGTEEAGDAVTDAFLAAGFGEEEGTRTRGAKPQLPGRTEMRVFQWQVKAK
jgi:hypothetical protein